MDFSESVVIDEVLGVGASVVKWYTMVYYEGETMFFWVGIHLECGIFIERMGARCISCLVSICMLCLVRKLCNLIEMQCVFNWRMFSM